MTDETAQTESPQALTLQQFCGLVRHTIDEARMAAWVCAEVGQISVSRGHYYIDLIQKSETTDMPVAKLRCTMWASLASTVMRNFQEVTGQEVTQGMRIMAFVSVSFHEVYGLSGNIQAIDPSFTIGELEMRRKAILAQLERDGVVEMNKGLTLPTVLQRIAIISAETAAGYGDFCDQMTHNGYGIDFKLTLFGAAVQGAEAEASIIRALDAVAARADEFDVVVIIRGGGSRMDLSCFDSYDLALNIAQFPLPVITGIGHERDHSIADHVAHTSVKTPTAVAEFIIGRDADFIYDLNEMTARAQRLAEQRLLAAKMACENLKIRLLATCASHIAQEKTRVETMQTRSLNMISQSIRTESLQLENLQTRATAAARNRLTLQMQKLQSAETYLNALDPRNVLKRGFTVTTDANGRRLTKASALEDGDTIRTHFADGDVASVVTTEKNNGN